MKFSSVYHYATDPPAIVTLVVILIMNCQLFNVIVAEKTQVVPSEEYLKYRNRRTTTHADATLMKLLPVSHDDWQMDMPPVRFDRRSLFLDNHSISDAESNIPEIISNDRYTNCSAPHCNRKHCDLSFSGIESIVTAIEEMQCNLDEIRTLNLSHNAIQAIPSGTFNNMTQLEWIDLSYNRIKTMGPITTSGKIHQLQTLSLMNNKLTHLPFFGRKTTGTLEINIGDNPLVCDNITYARVIQHNVQTEAVSFIGATCRSPFLLQPTPLFNVSDDVNIDSKLFGSWDDKHCPNDCQCYNSVWDNRHYTKCKSCNSSTIPGDIWDETNVLTLIDYTIKTLPKMPISRLHKLEEIHAVNLGLGQIAQGIFSNLQHLKVINMSDNNFRLITPSTFSGLLALEKLFLDSNKIVNVTSGCFTNLTGIQHLTLHHNRLRSIPGDIFDSNRNLQYLTLNGNELEYLPKNSFENNTALKFLTLPKHYFRCDCRTIWLKEWMQQDGCPVQNPDLVLCNETQEPILQTPNEEFKVRCLHHATLTLPTIAVAILFIVVICLILVNRDLVLVTIYTVTGFRFDHRVPKHRDDGRPFDAVIIYDNSDFEFVFHELFQNLDPQGPYKICFDGKDFVPGFTKMDNILKAVEYSKRTILVLSRRFLDNEECTFAFQTAHRENLRDHVNRIIVIEIEPIKQSGLHGELQTYLSISTNSKIKKDSRLFWQRLRYRMPDVSNRQPYVPKEGSHPFASLIAIGPRSHSLPHHTEGDDDDDFCILDPRYDSTGSAAQGLACESNSTLERNESSNLLSTTHTTEKGQGLRINTAHDCAINIPTSPLVRSPMSTSLLRWPRTHWQDDHDDTAELLDFTFDMFELSEDSLDDGGESPTFQGKLALLPLL